MRLYHGSNQPIERIDLTEVVNIRTSDKAFTQHIFRNRPKNGQEPLLIATEGHRP